MEKEQVMIVGIGVDIVENARIAELIEKHGPSFEQKVFTPGELGYAGPRRRRIEHLAVRFAAKEAVAKAFGFGMSNGISWLEIEIVHDDAGKPEVKLSGHVKDLSEKMHVHAVHVTLSHTETHSVAFVVAETA